MDLQQKLETSIILITHNLGVVAEFAKRVIVMYSGKVVEEAPVIPIFESPFHPYTIGLMGSMPVLGSKTSRGKQRLTEIPGMVPSLNELPGGCAFHPRCPYTKQVCKEIEPKLQKIDPEHFVSCWAATDWKT
jgi:oligopeptide/dipeptide ABC transporter ATP-binding protein